MIVEESIKKVYIDVLEREADSVGLEYYLSKIKNNEISLDNLSSILKNSSEYNKLKLKKELKIEKFSDFIDIDDIMIKEINDHLFLLDKGDAYTLETYSNVEYHEKTTVSFLDRIIKKGMNVINVGANIGYFTLLIAKLVGNDGKVYAFEPSIRTSKLLQKNIELNKYQNISVETKAVSDQNNIVDLWVGRGSVFNFVSSKAPEKDPELFKTTAKTTSIDDFISENKIKLDFLFMDAEGSEMKILEGMKKTLQENPNLTIITEYNPYTLELTDTSPKLFLELIEKKGFLIYLIDEEKKNVIEVSKEEVFKQIKHPRYSNLFLTRNKNNIQKF